MLRKLICLTTFAVLCNTSMVRAGIAITEFLNNAEGEDNGREWVELFNYGPGAVTMNGWTLADADSDSYAIPNGTTIPQGGYLILVSGGSGGISEAQAKSVFEREWLGGAADSRVIGMSSFALGNSDDELILKDGSSSVVWKLAWGNDENDHATWFTESGFSQVDWGTKGGPLISRAGDDLGVSGLRGYEANTSPIGGPLAMNDDPAAYESDFAAIQDSSFLSGIGLTPGLYDNAGNGSWGSPLAGPYSAVPEPATLVLMALGFWGLARKRTR